MLKLTIFIASIMVLVGLLAERCLIRRARRTLRHVIHINGTRGKSSLVRHISAGLRAGGVRVFGKTTGTVPLILELDGTEKRINRRGPANIREQISCLLQARKAKADVLVIECMAIDPTLQFVSEHRILRSNIGVITNVKRDHLLEMGPTLEDVCDALSMTIPRNGILFTADKIFFPQLKHQAGKLNTKAICVDPDINFEDNLLHLIPSNVSIALAVCDFVGVKRELALPAILSCKADPFAFSIFELPSGAMVANAFSANDPDSTMMLFDQLCTTIVIAKKRLIVLLNARPDRPDRTRAMLDLISKLHATELWILGSARAHGLTCNLKITTRYFRQAAKIDFDQLQATDIIFAIGNIAAEGMAFMARVQEEAKPYVQ